MKKKKEEMENCVSCGKETNIPKSMHIDYRRNYIQGAGQVCAKCADSLLP